MAPQVNIPELNSDTLSDNIQMPKSSTQKEVDHLSQCSLDNIVGKVTSTAQETLFRVERHVSCTLSASGVNMSKMDGTVYKPGAIMVLSISILPEFREILELLLYTTDKTQCLFMCKSSNPF